jgi:hypothetical protein
MLSERCVTLQAVDRARNVFRSWRCEIERDLFGVAVISVTFGRTGSPGRTVRRAVRDESAAFAQLRKALARRATSVRRCGVAYRVVECVGLDVGDRGRTAAVPDWRAEPEQLLLVAATG